MKQVSQLVNNMPAMSIVAPIKDSGDDVTGFVNAVFKQLKSIFPAWGNAWKNEEELNTAKQVWVRSFIENGITTKRQVAFGLKNCRALKTDFIPSVGKFIALCKPTPENLGLPNVEEAYKKACHDGLHHPVIDACIKELGSFGLKRGTVTLKQFEYVYMIKINRFANGERLTEKEPLAICNGAELTIAEKANQDAELIIQKRITEQGISSNADEVRKQLLAKLGIKRKEARA